MKQIIWCATLFFLMCVNAVSNKRYYPWYHLAPPKGWMNDPNGFSIYRNEYHLFYQYNPYSSYVPGIAHWRHSKSKDLFHWEDLGIALYPNMWYDKTGVFSGSAIVENNTMYLFFTGNVNFPGKQPDHLQSQALAYSTDGVNFTKYKNNPIIHASKNYPNIRDPKVWKHGTTYYMVLGNSFNNNTRGRVLLYTSVDKINWKNVSVLAESNGKLGYMWECPDFFELDGKFMLLFSPQGIKPQGDKYRNLYQTGYIIGTFNYKTLNFTPLTPFRELDHGHDFYATQTVLNRKLRIMVAWFDMWEENYPEQNYGFNGQMTIPRTLTLSSSNTILQEPVKEVAAARGRLIYKGEAQGDTTIALNDNAAEIMIHAKVKKDFRLYIESQNKSTTVSLSFDVKNRTLTLDRGGNDGIRRTQWIPLGSLFKWRIFIDASSIEWFSEGRTFSSRFFPDGPVNIRLGKKCKADLLKIYNMKRTLYAT